MSTAEIRDTLDRLTADERFFAAAYLHHLTQSSDAAWRQQMESTQLDMDSGRKFSLDRVRVLHESLSAQGL